MSLRNLFELNSKKNIFLSVLSDKYLFMLKELFYYIVFVFALQLFLFLFVFGTNYKFSLMLGILGLNTLLLSILKSIKSKRVKVRNR